MLFRVELTRTMSFIAEGESREAVEKAAKALAGSPWNVEDWDPPDWEVGLVMEHKPRPGKPAPEPDVVLVNNDFLHPSDAQAALAATTKEQT